ncbi:uncharacterized protein LOC111687972 [Lucilia cuprina]|uniref:uncharacterized protein LOC111687972 n=1 Tax=Lucilia cuprina TaxID=7375 RepID=UPI001F053D3C|nr:uncharacterized protein LOC111687972 [Lucilia cuprina]
MLNKACVVIICLIVIQQIQQTCSKSLPTLNKDHVDESKNPTTTYYRHNIFGPNTYAFGFEVNDKVSGNIQFRDERRYANGTIEGSYGYVRPDGSVMVTHFMADSELGYLSQSQNFEPGDEPKWQENWPTKRPNILMEKPLESLQPTVIYDDKEKLNLTSILLPVEPIKEKHGIDLNPPELEKELVNPAVLEVINGEAPLLGDKNKKDNSLGFETIHQFIPPEFPIVPFQLPQEDINIKLNEGLSAKPIPVLKKTNESDRDNKYDQQKLNNAEKSLNLNDNDSPADEKYVKSQENNAEKSLPAKAIKSSASNEENLTRSPQAKSISFDKNTDWYDKVIKKTRQEYLETVQ